MKFPCIERLYLAGDWITHQKSMTTTMKMFLDFSRYEHWVLCCLLTAMAYWSNFFENWHVWKMVSPAKYFHKHTFSDIFPAFCAHFTASVASLLIFFNNNNDGKGKSLEVVLKTSGNTLTSHSFFSLYSWSSSTKLELVSL